MNNNQRTLLNLSVALAITLFFLFTYIYPVNLGFPFYDYSSTLLKTQLVPIVPFDDIATSTSRFLWDNKALDLVNQAYVLLAAVLCCLALLKDEGV